MNNTEQQFLKELNNKHRKAADKLRSNPDASSIDLSGPGPPKPSGFSGHLCKALVGKLVICEQC
ncbi:hypothetical protein [Nitrosomonas sp. ANs5]|uniref:hypothetical protein n=1 Tax=Nitrosomonas sp. ANs5 TaxID=3423941 RepID=UPI003D32D616